MPYQNDIVPIEIKLNKQARSLDVTFSNEKQFRFSFEYLREHTPSADKRRSNKDSPQIVKIEPVGRYAIKLFFDDGHNSGLYTWEYLYELGMKV